VRLRAAGHLVGEIGASSSLAGLAGADGAVGGAIAYIVAWAFRLFGHDPDFSKVTLHGLGIGGVVGVFTWVGFTVFG
jgi:hypothetical protein